MLPASGLLADRYRLVRELGTGGNLADDVGHLRKVAVKALLVRFDDPSRPSLRRDSGTDGTRVYCAVAEPASDISIVELRTRVDRSE